MIHAKLRELLIEQYDCASFLLGKHFAALGAVLELHKPRDYKDGNWCVGCNADFEYPCPTIQAIEKELG